MVCIKKMFTITSGATGVKIHIREWTMNGYPTHKGVTIPLQRWVNLLAHMKGIDKSMMKIKNEDDSSVDVRYKPGGDLVIGVQSPYWNVDRREFYRSDSERNGLPIYNLQDWSDRPIKGAFYESAISPAWEPEDSIYKIEFILTPHPTPPTHTLKNV